MRIAPLKSFARNATTLTLCVSILSTHVLAQAVPQTPTTGAATQPAMPSPVAQPQAQPNPALAPPAAPTAPVATAEVPSAPAQNAVTKPAAAAAKKDLRPKTPPITMQWIDVKGDLISSVNPTGTSWTWSLRNKMAAIKTPAVRVWLKSNLQADWKATFLSSEGASLVKAPEHGADDMIVDLRSTKAAVRFRFTDPTNHTVEMSLVLQAAVTKTYTFSTPECEKLDLFLKMKKNEARHLYMGVYCQESQHFVDIYAIRSDDAKWNKDTEAATLDPKNQIGELKQQVFKSKEAIIYSKAILPGGTEDEYGGLTEYHVLYVPKIKPKRFYMSAGLGVTVYDYKERATSVNLSQTSLTAKVNAGYRLIPKLLDVAFNFFGNVFTLAHSPTTFAATGFELPPAYFYGLNGRLGYRLPVGLGATEFMFLSGWYFWSMRVNAKSPDSLYGLKSLNGPQLFFMAINSPQGKRGGYAYIKLALISDRFNLQDINNREIAIGGGYELSKFNSKPLSATLDIAHTRFYNTENGMTLISYTLGLSKAI